MYQILNICAHYENNSNACHMLAELLMAVTVSDGVCYCRIRIPQSINVAYVQQTYLLACICKLLVWLLTEWTPYKARPVGRPRLRWMDQVEEDLKRMRITG
jgi:hypothetical protein